MDHRLKRVAPWINIHAIASLLSIVLLVVGFELSKIAMAAGASSYYIGLGFAFLAAETVSGVMGNVLSIACLAWVVILPICAIIFYILFRKKGYVKPYFILAAIDSLIVIGWFVCALITGEVSGEIFYAVDAVGSAVMLTGMAVSYWRSAL